MLRWNDYPLYFLNITIHYHWLALLIRPAMVQRGQRNPCHLSSNRLPRSRRHRWSSNRYNPRNFLRCKGPILCRCDPRRKTPRAMVGHAKEKAPSTRREDVDRWMSAKKEPRVEGESGARNIRTRRGDESPGGRIHSWCRRWWWWRRRDGIKPSPRLPPPSFFVVVAARCSVVPALPLSRAGINSTAATANEYTCARPLNLA